MLFKDNKLITKTYKSINGDKIYPIIVDIKRGIQGSEPISFMTSDVHTGVLTVALTNNSEPYNVVGHEVICTIKRPDGVVADIECTHLQDNLVEVELGTYGTRLGGVYTFDIKVQLGEERVAGTPLMNYTVSESLSLDDMVEEDDRLPILDLLINQVQESTELVEQSYNKVTNLSENMESVIHDGRVAIEEVHSAIANIPSKDELIGEKGDKGDKGDRGDKGDKGEKGEQGIQGIQGERGLQGERGIQGEKGDAGEKGDTGEKGDRGDAFTFEDFTEEQLRQLKGDKGEQGVQGIQGVKGDKGEKGEKGVQGEKGEQGEPFRVKKIYPSILEMESDFSNSEISEGSFVLINTDNVEDSDNAKLFIKTSTSYSFVTDLSGATGIQGAKGDRGLQGEKGDKGDRGDRGEQGIQGIQGEKGDRGEQGIQGIQGEKGADGLTTSITIGSTKYTHTNGNIVIPPYPTLSSLGGVTQSSINIINTNIGTLSSLVTTNKTSIVSAINEVFQYGTNVKQRLVDVLVANEYDCSTSNTWEELFQILQNSAIKPPIAESIDYTSVPNATYGFIYQPNLGMYESTNQGVNSSYAICRVNIVNPNKRSVRMRYIQYTEGDFDYGMVSQTNTPLSLSPVLDSSVMCHFKGDHSSSICTYTLGVVNGFIDVKYIKDGSDSDGYDAFRFIVEFI